MIELGLGSFEKRTADHRAVVVEQDVDTPEACHCRFHEGIEIGGNGDIAWHITGAIRMCFEKARERRRTLGIEITRDHLGAFAQKQIDRNLALPTGCAGDDADLVLQTSHDELSPKH